MQVDEHNSFDDLLNRLRASLATLRELGIRVAAGSRLERYERLLQQVLEDPRPAIEEQVVFAMAFVLREVDEIVEIVDHLPPAPEPEVHRLLSLLPGGSDHPDDEVAAKAREAQYELYLGSVFRRAGLDATHGHPDLTVRFAGSDFAIEAKRPSASARVDDRVRSAVHQLRSGQGSGVIALSLDQVIRPRHTILGAPTLAEVAPEVARLVAQYVQQEKAMWKKRLKSEPVDAVLFTARIPARLESSGHLVLGSAIHVEPISQCGQHVEAFLTAAVAAYQQAQARRAA